MKAKPRRWFILPSGDDVNQVISLNFPDATFQDQIHLEISGKNQTKSAWEVSIEVIQEVLNFLRTSHIDGKLIVAVRIDESDIRIAERDEFDKKFKKKKSRQSETRQAIGGKRGGTFIELPPGKSSTPSATSFPRPE